MTRDQVLGFARRPRQVTKLEIEGFGTVHLRSMTGLEWERLSIKLRGDNVVDGRARVAVAAWCNPEGVLMFGEHDVPEVNALDWHVLEKIRETVFEGSPANAEAVAETAKN